jgi:hypothetical protein
MAGDCCGAKHIHGLGGYPDQLMAARRALKPEETSFNHPDTDENMLMSGASNDMRHVNDRQDMDFFYKAAPKESYAARFRRFIRFLKEERKHHMVDVVLASYQVTPWLPHLTKAGFVAGPTWTNSNTSRKLQVFYLVY